MHCPICNDPSKSQHQAREMMFGYRDQFDYAECGNCGCVWLPQPPNDMSKYYPSTYYSLLKAPAPIPTPSINPVRRWVWEHRNEAQALKRGGVWGLVARARPRPDVRPLKRPLREIPRLRFSSRILDVGCGNGHLLRDLAAIGFRDLTGIDPYLKKDQQLAPGVQLIADRLENLNSKPFHVIMFHHSLEHIAEQKSTLQAARQLIADGGTCLIRIPTVSSELWRRYGTDWVEFDAPRHLVLHSHESLRRLALETGFEVTRLWCDSDAFGYWASELYRRDVPLKHLGTGVQVEPEPYFSAEELENFKQQVKFENHRNDGGRLVAYLTPMP